MEEDMVNEGPIGHDMVNEDPIVDDPMAVGTSHEEITNEESMAIDTATRDVDEVSISKPEMINPHDNLNAARQPPPSTQAKRKCTIRGAAMKVKTRTAELCYNGEFCITIHINDPNYLGILESNCNRL